MMYAIQEITIGSSQYPTLLQHIASPPARLYVRGDTNLLSSQHLLAVVGSRRATLYGSQCVAYLLPDVLECGVIIVSGLAFGIDSIGHKICVDLGRPTIAVLGSGADDDSVTPRSHLTLAHKILEGGGLIVSEYPPGTPALPHQFPARNRIIAGLSHITLIIQAREHSGSLITARLALESNRDVLAVPGPITDPLCRGSNTLIRDGAQPVLCAQDILNAFEITGHAIAHHSPKQFPKKLEYILHMLSSTPKHLDTLIAESSRPPEDVLSSLTELELHGGAHHVGGGKYIKAKESF